MHACILHEGRMSLHCPTWVDGATCLAREQCELAIAHNLELHSRLEDTLARSKIGPST